METQSQEIPTSIESLLKNQWITETVDQIEKNEPGQRMEYVLPENVNHLDFIALLGLPQRDFEIGGVYNTVTRSMLVSRGTGSKDRGMANPTVQTPRLRRNADMTTDDILFHTHPWNEKDVIQFTRDPKNTCEPSDTDKNNPMAFRMIEEEAGIDTKIVSIVSSGGYITIMEVPGSKINSEVLKDHGVTDTQITNLKSELVLAPFPYLDNLTDGSESNKEEIRKRVDQFYIDRKKETHIPFSQKLKKLQTELKPFCNNGYVDRVYQNQSQAVINHIEHHLPKYLSVDKLKQMGFTEEQIPLVQEMIGVTIKKQKQL